ncbi:hypothetical protein HID58_011585 [Brassica napus]|uniref:Uncharacterized protein n=1 Tax=Brassica napus TaxID=3708 RepID=A0ABQ7Z0W3_BRANA|nr:hypothetical protein HID58_071199 [Brassica napus]KAH0934468.1 hypothetical protein HID58_011585 [Brassica napus]
MRMATPRSR